MQLAGLSLLRALALSVDWQDEGFLTGTRVRRRTAQPNALAAINLPRLHFPFDA